MSQNNHPIPIAPAPLHGHGLPAAASQSPPPNPSMPYTCLTCTRRKVKCDKLSPICSTCRKAKLDCQYQAPAPRKRRRLDNDSVHERLEKYESILREHGLYPKDPVIPTPESIDDAESRRPSNSLAIHVDERAEPTDPHKHGKMIYASGKARWIDTTLWRALGDEALDPVTDDEEGEDEDDVSTKHRMPNQPNQPTALDPISTAILGGGQPYVSLLDLHPTYDHAMIMWNTHVQHVEPIVKVLHIPTTLQLIQRAASSPGSVSRPTECICFAVYHFAVQAMTEDECKDKLGENRDVLRARYHNALRQALINAQFFRTTDFGVIQAYVLFCLSVRTEYDQQTFWILTGIAVRMGQRIGLHRDGVDLGLKPFDTQMRRRLFWQLLPLDGLASQLGGTGIAMPASTWSTKQPWNLNDTDITPSMTTAPPERTGATDMIFCLTRSEVGKFHQKAKPTLGHWPRLWETTEGYTLSDLESYVSILEESLETKYIRYCDMLNPVHCLTMAMARGGTAVARFRIRLHRFLSPPETTTKTDAGVSRQETLTHAIRVLDYATNALTNPALVRFRWHMDAFFTWDALVFVLNELRREEPLVEVGEAWGKVERILDHNRPFLEQKRALHVATGTLTLRAWERRPSPVYTGGREPKFIAVLKEAAGKREARRKRREEGTVGEVGSVGNGWCSSIGDGSTPFMSNEQLDEFINLDNMDWSSWDHLFQNPDNLAVAFPELKEQGVDSGHT